MQYIVRIKEESAHIVTVDAKDEFDALDQGIIALRNKGVRSLERDRSRYSGVSITSVTPAV